MDYARRIIQELLMEEVQQNVLINAIKKRHEVSFVYNSGDGDSRGKKERITVQPVCYGLTSAGNPCFRAYQILGSSESAEKKEGVIPGWRLFLLDKVVSNTWKDSGKVFDEPPMYNEHGDKTMSEVLVQADFREKQLKNRNKTMAPDYVLKNIQDTEKSQAEREAQWADAMRARGNNASVADMAKQRNFGNNQQQQTIGPVKKNTVTATAQQSNTPNTYKGALQNGPRYKGNEEEINNDETDTEENEY